MLDIDLGQELVSFVLVFVALPTVWALVVIAAIVRLVRNATRRLAIGLYLMLASTFIAPAPLIWGDQHLGLPSSQALEGYSVLFWAIGAASATASLESAFRWRQLATLAVGLILGAIVLGGWLLSGALATAVWNSTASASGCTPPECGAIPIGARLAAALAVIPLIGTAEVLLACGWLVHRIGLAIDWGWAMLVAASAAVLLVAYVYLRAPDPLASPARGLDLVVLPFTLSFVLAVLRTPASRPHRSSRHLR